jgi:hypothetical protein
MRYLRVPSRYGAPPSGYSPMRATIRSSSSINASAAATLRTSYHSRAAHASAIASLWRATFSADIYRPSIIRRALDQGTVLALPESSSRMRRPISSAQAASASSSIVSSRLSMSDPANAARASTGSLRAFSNSSDVSLFTLRFYQTGRSEHAPSIHPANSG